MNENSDKEHKERVENKGFKIVEENCRNVKDTSFFIRILAFKMCFKFTRWQNMQN